jgi:formamidopyrimidine-DNA glycosylase
VPRDLARRLRGEEVLDIRRRGKYLLFDFRHGHLLAHLGMSGRLSVVAEDAPPRKHDHVDVQLEGHQSLRLTDPRRFGAMLWLPQPAEGHALLAGLGLEPLDRGFTGQALRDRAKGRRVAVKQFLMNGRIVVGVGNIYASEALFRAGIRPTLAAGPLSRPRYPRQVAPVQEVQAEAIDSGGSTLRDYVDSSGARGSFQLVHNVYGRDGKPCRTCGTPIRLTRQGQRASYYCPGCQR